MDAIICAIEQGGEYIRFVSNPPEELQLKIVEKEPLHIYYIKNPSEKVQLAAIRKNPEAIQNIENPTEKVQLEFEKLDRKSKEDVDHTHILGAFFNNAYKRNGGE